MRRAPTNQLQDGIHINLQNQQLTRPQLKDFSETSTTPGVISGTLTLNLETGNVFDVTPTGNVTTLVLANPPASGRPSAIAATMVRPTTEILTEDVTSLTLVSAPASGRAGPRR